MEMGQIFLAILFNPFNLCYRSSRFFFLNVMLHIICVPLYKVLILWPSLDTRFPESNGDTLPSQILVSSLIIFLERLTSKRMQPCLGLVLGHKCANILVY